MQELRLSPLGHTWILDLDGTIVKHNGYKLDGFDTLLDGAKSFIESIPQDDMIIFVTSRKKEYSGITEKFLNNYAIRYDCIIYDAPYGERILINDCKVSGLKTAISINTQRDNFEAIQIGVDENI